MILSRREVLWIGRGFLAALPLSDMPALGDERVDIAMSGSKDGSRVWFEPVGMHIRPGRTVRWTNKDLGNINTSTAYHPDNEDRPPRIPDGAESWNSDYLLPDQSFSIVLSVPGVYDYFCVPHESAGMVGRILVSDGSQLVSAPAADGIPEVAEKAFPTVEEIVRAGRVSWR